MKNKLPRLLATVVSTLLIAQSLSAVTLPFYEPFPTSYGDGTLLGAGNTATNWSLGNGTSAGQSAYLTNTAALSYSGLPDASGYGIVCAVASSRNRGVDFGAQTFSDAAPAVYSSFLLRVRSLPAGNKCLAYFRNGTGGGTPHAGIFINASGSLTLSKNSGTPAVIATSALTLDQTYLVVVRYKYVAGSANDEVGLWLNPAGSTFGGDEASVPTPTISTTSGSDQTSLQGFFIAGITADTSIQQMDELRLGLTWASVLPTSVCTTVGISAQPANQTAFVGSTATFTISASGSSPTYQWQNSVNGGSTWNNISGANTASYTTPTLATGDNNTQFRCIASVGCDTSSATSAAATLTVVDGSIISFRSVATGNWNSTATWEQSTDGNTWNPASSTPTSVNSTITVRNGHVVTVTTATTADDLVIQAGGEVVASGATITIADGAAATDCDVSGTLTVANVANSSFTNGGGLVFESGGKFVWARTTAPVAAIPTATWNSGSTCEIQGTSGQPTALGQGFYNFTWNYPAATASIDLGGNLTTIHGDLTTYAPNSPTAGTMKLYNSLANTSVAMTIDRNVNVAQGYLNLMGGSASNSTITLNIGGNFNIASGATLDLRNSGAGSGAFIIFTNASVPQNFSNGGDIVRTGGNGINKIVWVVKEGCTLNVGPGSLILRTNDYITGGGTLNISANGGVTGGNGTNLIASALNTVHFGGTLTLENLPVFSGGESFQLFDATNRTGGFTSIVPATPGDGLSWDTSQLTTSGVLAVAIGGGGGGGGPVKITAARRVGSDIILTINGGVGNANTNFSVLSSTSPATPAANWNEQATGLSLDASGVATYTNAISGSRLFYLIRLP